MRTIPLMVAAMLLAGCTPMPPAPSPSTSIGPVTPAAPQFHCTPDGSQTAAPCTEAEYNAQVERDKQYAEAESLYRKLVAADTELFKKGAPADDSVLQYVADNARRLLVEAHSDGSRYKAEGPQVRWIRRMTDFQREGAVLAITACMDSTHATLIAPDGSEAEGSVAEQNAYFALVEGQLKVVHLGYVEVESC